MEKQRLIWADSLKGWLMILVILGHAIQMILGKGCNENHLWNFIYSFHMPAFMAVSGWLAYRVTANYKPIDCNKLGCSCKRRSYQLLIPYLAWSILQFLLSGDYSLGRLSKMVLYPDTYFWFLWVLFWICVVFTFAQWLATKCKINEMLTIGGLCMLLLGLMIGMEIRIFGFQFLAYYFLFYTIGYCLHKYEDAIVLEVLRKALAIITMTILWVFLASGWTMQGLPVWMPAIPHVPDSLLQYAFRGFTALVAIVVIISTAPLLVNGKNKLNNWICQLGVVSLGLYVVHLSLVGSVAKWVKIYYPELEMGQFILVFVITFTLSYLVVWLLQKNKYAARVFLGKL